MTKAKLGTLEGGGDFALDLETLMKTRLLIQGTSGSGKSHALRKLLETTHGKLQQFVLDPDGEFGSLREKFDYVLVGEGGDLPADPETAEPLARRLRELGASAILNLYELKREAQNEFVKNFLEGLMNAPKAPERPALVALDEAHRFAPNNFADDCTTAVIDVGSRGRKRGYALIPATQRISKLHKDVIAECLNKLVGRTQLDLDLKRITDEFGYSKKDDAQALRKLSPGEFFAMGPAIGDEILRVQIGEVETKHGAAAAKFAKLAPPPTARVVKALEKLADLQKAQEQEVADRAALEQRVKDLERELRAASGVPPAKREEIFQQGYEKARIEGARVMAQLKNRLLSKLKELTAIVEGISDDGSDSGDKGLVVDFRRPPQGIPARLLHSTGRVRSPAMTEVAGELGKTELAILRFLGSMEGKWFTRAQIGVRTGYSRKSSTFQQAFPTLVKEGLVASIDGRFAVTDVQAGAVKAVLGPNYEAPVAGRPEDWIPKLTPTAGAIFRLILLDRKHEFTREELSRVSGYSVRSSTFQGAFPELEQLGLTKKGPGGGVMFNIENFS